MTITLVVVSRGSCPRRAIELVGFTSKDGVSTVGRFGSGTAFAIALALREKLSVTIASHDVDGPYEMEPFPQQVVVGESVVDRVRWRFRRGSSVFRTWWDTTTKALSLSKRVDTSFTTQLGKSDWHGAWPVVREFVSNARDADTDGFDVYQYNSSDVEQRIAFGIWAEEYLDAAVSAGHSAVTVVTLAGDALSPVIGHGGWWCDRFRFDVKSMKYGVHPVVLWSDEAWKAVRDKPSEDGVRVYVRGVRCELPPGGPTPKALYEYDLDTNLTEARTVMSKFSVDWDAITALNAAVRESPREFGPRLLRAVHREPTCYEATLFQACEYGYLTSGPHWREAFAHTFGVMACVADVDTAEAKVPGAVVLPRGWSKVLGDVGVPMAKSRVVVMGGGRGEGGSLHVHIPMDTRSSVLDLSFAELEWLYELVYAATEAPEGVDKEGLEDRLEAAGTKSRALKPTF